MQRKWWKTATCYQIYMSSFQDGNHDGIGDFSGLQQRIAYLADLGVTAIWLTPFYPSPKVDNGYDVADYCAIDPLYGTMADFEACMAEATKYGIKIIIDLVCNHVSTQHQWFQEVRENPLSDKRDYFIWQQEIPNNWESYFGGSAWEYCPEVGAYYYHAFAKEQVNLNWTNPQVIQEFQEICQFWLAKGVAGFRFDVINFFVTDETAFIQANPYAEDGTQIHHYDQNYQGIETKINELCRPLKASNPDLFLIGEIGSESCELLAHYVNQTELDVVFNFNVGSQEQFILENLVTELNCTYQQAPTAYPTLFFSSHDMPRFTTRFFGGDEQLCRMWASIQLSLKGVPFIYYGDEIGMENLAVSQLEELRDIQGRTHYEIVLNNGGTPAEALQAALKATRDYSRGPMQWDEQPYFGFSQSEPWIYVEPKRLRTVKQQASEQHSILATYKQLIQLRKTYPTLQTGAISQIELVDNCVVFRRFDQENEFYIYANFSENIHHFYTQGKIRWQLGEGTQTSISPASVLIIQTKGE